MRINRLEQALVAAGMTALLGCNVTLGELKAINPRAATLEVPCRPAIVPENVKVMAVQSESGHIVTDEDQDELLEFARLAGVFIKFNNSAPKENAAIMASEYGLSCPNLSSTKQSSPAPFRSEEPCSSEAAQSNGRANANLLGDVGKAPCDSSGQTKEAKKAPVRVKVCVRPPWVPKPHKDAKGNWVTVTEWAIVLGNKKVEWTKDPKRYAEQVAQYADVIFVLDESAPLESVYYFTKDPKKLSCPGGAPRKSYDQVAGSIDMPMLSEVTAAREAKEQADAEKAAAGNGNGKGSHDGDDLAATEPVVEVTEQDTQVEEVIIKTTTYR